MLMMFYRVNECTLPFNGAKNETFLIKKLLKSSVFFYAKRKMPCLILNNCVLMLEKGLVSRLNEKKRHLVECIKFTTHISNFQWKTSMRVEFFSAFSRNIYTCVYRYKKKLDDVQT